MAWSTEISQLVTETEQFIDAVELKKPVLDAAANTAVQNATAASLAAANTAAIAASLTTSADLSKGYAVATEAIANSAKMQQDAVSDSERQASLAAGYALSTGSIVQQDLTGVTAAALHRSPNVVTSLFVYDTSKDSDGGAWTEKCQNTSWYNEDLSGRWLGPQPSELFARHEGGSLGPELSVNGDFSSGLTSWVGASGGSANIVNNQAVVSTPAGDGYGGIRQNITLSIGKFYQISWDVIAYSGAGWRVEAANNADTGTRTGLGSFSLRFQATTASALITIAASSNAVNMETVTFDNFSIREVTAVTSSNDYYQSTVDGKFYRLWKNLLSYSEDFANTAWLKTGSSASNTTATTDPLGGSTADFLVENNASSVHAIGYPFSVIGGDIRTYSVYVKSAGRNFVSISGTSYNSPAAMWWATYDLTTGDIVKNANVTATATSVGNGWWRLTYSYIAPYPITASARFGFWLGMSSTFTNPATNIEYGNTYTGDGVSGLYIWGAQLEHGSTATTYEVKTIGAATSEVFRGNKRDFPRLAGIVTESNNLTIYDLTEPGRPMWMRFLYTPGFLSWLSTAINISGISALNGYVVPISSSNMGGLILNFAKDDVILIWNGSYVLRRRQLVDRNSLNSFSAEPGGFIVANTLIYGIAMTVLPDAPTDPVTGLKVPTIAVATNNGVSIIKHNGTVINSTETGIAYEVSIDNQYNMMTMPNLGNNNGLNFYVYPWNNTTSFSRNGFAERFLNNTFENGSTLNNLLYGNRKYAIHRTLSPLPIMPLGVGFMVDDDLKGSLQCNIGADFISGYLPKDTKLAIMGETITGTVTGGNLVPNADFSQPIGTSWTAEGNGIITANTATASISFTNVSKTYEHYYTVVPTSINKSYQYNANYTGSYYTSGVAFSLNDNNGWFVKNAYTNPGQFNVTAASTSYIQFRNVLALNNTFTVNNIRLEEAIPDLSDYAIRNIGSGHLSKAGLWVQGTLTKSPVATGAKLTGYSGFSGSNYAYQDYNSALNFGTGDFCVMGWLTSGTTPTSVILSRGVGNQTNDNDAFIIAVTASGQIVARIYDSVGTMTGNLSGVGNIATGVTSWRQFVLLRRSGTTEIYIDGRLDSTSQAFNGDVIGGTTNPVLQIGRSASNLWTTNYFSSGGAGSSLALIRISATAPTANQIQKMYEEEKQLFREGSTCVLPDSTAITAVSYDDTTNRLLTTSATNKSYWSGLVRTAVVPVPAGTYSKTKITSGVELSSRITTGPGVDVTIPTYLLRSDLNKRAEAASKAFKEIVNFDYVGGFTASTTSGSTAITSVTNLTYPVSPVGARISGTGIPTNATIVAVVGTTMYISAAATATGTGVSLSFLDFELPTGFETETVTTAGAIRREGTTADFTRLYSDFVETVRFAVAPGATTWVQIQASRIIS